MQHAKDQTRKTKNEDENDGGEETRVSSRARLYHRRDERATFENEVSGARTDGACDARWGRVLCGAASRASPVTATRRSLSPEPRMCADRVALLVVFPGKNHPALSPMTSYD